MNIYRVYKNRRDVRMFLEIILSLLTISFFAAAALRPTALTITQLLNDINTKEEIVNNLDTKIENLVAAQSVFNQEANRLVYINSALPESPTPENFMRQVQGIASLKGVSINNFVMNDITIIGSSADAVDLDLARFPQGAGEIRFSINVLGDYAALISFISDLENARRPVKIDVSNLNITGGSNSTQLILSATGRFPYFKNNE